MAFRYTFNPFTGNFDRTLSEKFVRETAKAEAEKVVDSIATSAENALGNKRFSYDPVACKWVEMPPLIVTDENGKVVYEDSEDAP